MREDAIPVPVGPNQANLGFGPRRRARNVVSGVYARLGLSVNDTAGLLDDAICRPFPKATFLASVSLPQFGKVA
jgi:hypothetical protein